FNSPWNSDRHPSDSDSGPGSDPQGEGRGTAAWTRRHAQQPQGPTGARPPQTRPRGQGDADRNDSRSAAGDVTDIGLGRNDAAQFLTDVRDTNALTRRGSRNDAELARRTMK